MSSTVFNGNYIYLFIFCFLASSILEYATGFVLEKLFHSKWWDYTDDPFNIHGRICIPYSALWAIMGVVIIKIIQPYGVVRLIELIPKSIGAKLIYVLIGYFIIDTSVTIFRLVKLKELIYQLENITTEIKSNVVKLKVVAVKKASSLHIKNLSRKFLNKYEYKELVPKELKEKYEYIVDKIVTGYSRLFIAFPHFNSKRLKTTFKDIRNKIVLKNKRK